MDYGRVGMRCERVKIDCGKVGTVICSGRSILFVVLAIQYNHSSVGASYLQNGLGGTYGAKKLKTLLFSINR